MAEGGSSSEESVMFLCMECKELTGESEPDNIYTLKRFTNIYLCKNCDMFACEGYEVRRTISSQTASSTLAEDNRRKQSVAGAISLETLGMVLNGGSFDEESPVVICRKCKELEGESGVGNDFTWKPYENFFKCHKCGWMSFLGYGMWRNTNSFQSSNSTLTEDEDRVHNVAGASFQEKLGMGLNSKGKRTTTKFHVCSICGIEFLLKSNLNSHMLTHTAEKCYECKWCSRKFKFKKNLSRHIKKLHRLFLLHCTVCCKRFHSGSQLVDHMRTHTGKKPLVCEFCQKLFRYETRRRIHEQNTKIGVFNCKLCGEEFRRMCAYREHMNMHYLKGLHLH